MPGLKEVKIRIKSVLSTQQITKAMKMVAASKLRKAQDNILQMRPYADKLNEILSNVINSLEGRYESEYSQTREVKNILLIPITSDRGLCGAFNSNIYRRVKSLVEEELTIYYKERRLLLMPIGKKSYDFFRKRNFDLVEDYWEMFHGLNFEKVKLAAQYILNGYSTQKFDKVIIVYNEFKNVATQILRVEQFLPITTTTGVDGHKKNYDYIFEPDKSYIVRELIPKLLTIKFYKAILESNASEHGARMTAMDQATENANEILNELNLTYNRTRQATITREINEIVGGANALG